MASPFLQLHFQSVVTRSCECADVDVAAVVRVHIVEGWRAGIPEGHLAADTNAGRIAAGTERRGEDRISVANHGQVNSVVAYVGNREGHVPGQLLLNASVVLNHVRALVVVVDERRGNDTGVGRTRGDAVWERPRTRRLIEV